MPVKKKTSGFDYKKAAFYGAVVVALGIIAYFSFSPKQEPAKTSIRTESSTPVKSAEISTSSVATATPGNLQSNNTAPGTSTQKSESDIKLNSDVASKTAAPVQSSQPKANDTVQAALAPNTSDSQPKPTVEPVKATPAPTAKTEDFAIKIPKSEVSGTAKFYPYKLDNINMEVIAVKATDGTIRTALNTCQVCYDSGRGYYVQSGEYLVCQNCKNRFHIDQVEKVKGGCNPVPILEADKKDTGDSILISKDFMAKQKEYFSKWKK